MIAFNCSASKYFLRLRVIQVMSFACIKKLVTSTSSDWLTDFKSNRVNSFRWTLEQTQKIFQWVFALTLSQFCNTQARQSGCHCNALKELERLILFYLFI